MQSEHLGSTELPLNHQQLLMWTGQQLDPDAPLYNMGFSIQIPTAINQDVFKTALQTVVDNSPSLRTVVRTIRGEPVLETLSTLEFEIPVFDFSDRENPERDALAWCEQRCQELFVLSQRLFDAALIRLAAEKYVLYINHNHIISDAWASTQLLDRLSKVYSAMIAGRSTSDLEFVCQPADSAGPSNGRKPNPRVRPIAFYGFEQSRIGSGSQRLPLVDDDSDLESTLDRLVASDEAKTFSVELSRFNVLLTLLFALLGRVSGQRELCVGVPFHNRLTSAQKLSLGLYITLHPIEVRLDNDDTFRTLFEKVKIASNQYLVSATSGNDSGNANCDYNVIFNFINARFGEFAGAPVQATWLHPGCHDRQHHLRMHVEGFGGESKLRFDFNDDVFGEHRQSHLLSHYSLMIQEMGRDWDRQISQIELVPREAIETKLAAASSHEISTESLIAQFDRRVTDSAQQIAVRCEDRTYSYQQLGSLVDQILGHLVSLDLGQQQRIAIGLKRGVHAVAAMLAVMKSGNSFIPLDPSWPPVRIQQILDDASACCVITTSNQELPLDIAACRVNLDQDLRTGVAETAVELNLSDSAYVLFTSGSTGQPKGVDVSHASIAHYVNWAAEFYGRGKPLSFPLFTPLTFDLTLTSIFVPLVSGGTLVVYRERPGGQDTALLQVLKDDLVDIIKLTPSHLSLLTGQDYRSSRVRQLILGGEDLSLDLARRTLGMFPPGTKIHNEYGPTEATVGCIIHTFDPETKYGGMSVPIGKPIPGTSAWIVGQELTMQPEGVAGELCVSGTGLAKGYLNRTELTHNKFVTHPSFPDLKVYRTGDIARWNEQGELVYLGRIDDQVKIRGARIELKSIESALREFPDIEEAVVTAYHPRSKPQFENCSRCGLASNFPGTEFDENGVCDQCNAFETYRDKAAAYFRNTEELRSILSGKKVDDAGFDCLALLSGGKDSSYMVAKLADLDLKVLAFTLDNGYISDEAKANIRRVTETLGVEHVFGSTPHMNQIFVDSLKRHSNVCQGCFKTIYTLAMNLALEKNIPFIVTGLSRGQLFETRLTRDLFDQPRDSLVQIDQSVLDARKAYHRQPDAVSEYLDVELLQRESSFDRVQFVDFYRFCHVTLDEMLSYLNQKLPWIRPADTGRSTNCLINDVGIYVHQRNEGFHNYTLPYSWDVRMGHKTRDEAVDELRDRIDVPRVHEILEEIGYDGDLAPQDQGPRLIAYYTSNSPIDPDEIRSFLESRLPDFMLPTKLLQIDEIPLTDHGKVDSDQLPDPFSSATVKHGQYVAPRSELENGLVDVWQRVLGIERIGVRDNFFDLGGDSILAIQIVALANLNGIRIKPADMFETLTIEKLAIRANNPHEVVATDPGLPQEYAAPIQAWMLEHNLSASDSWTQSLELKLPSDFVANQLPQLGQALAEIVNSNPALRTTIVEQTEFQLNSPVENVDLRLVDVRGHTADDLIEAEQSIERELTSQLTVFSNQLIAGRVVQYEEQDFRLVLMINHLAVDAVSWQRITSDLNLYFAEENQFQSEQVATMASWTKFLRQNANDRFAQQLEYWQDAIKFSPPCPGPEKTVRRRTGAGFEKLDRRLGSRQTATLQSSLKQSRLRMHELLLAAFAKSLADFTGRQQFRIFVEGHGREHFQPNVDYSRTIGWFTSLYPVAFCVPQADLAQTVAAFKEQIRSIPDGGVGFGVLKYLHGDPIVRQSLGTTQDEIVFNYLGRQIELDDRPVTPTRPLRLHRSEAIERRTSLEFSLSMTDELAVTAEFARDSFTTADLEAIVTGFFESAQQMAQLQADQAPVSASDFPLANLDSRQLGDLAAALKRSEKKE